MLSPPRALLLLLACRGLGDAFLLERCSHKCETVCDLRSENKSNQQPSKRIAVLVVGLRDRYYPLPTLRHVVAPAAKSGFEVDYFVSLSTYAARQHGSSHAAYWYKPFPNPRFENFTASALEGYIVQYARHFGASRAAVLLRGQDVEIAPPPPGRTLSAYERRTVRSLHRMKAVELLWNWTRDQAFGVYDLYMLMFEDLYFVDDVDPTRFVDPGMVYSAGFGPLCRPGEALPGGGGAAGLCNDRVLALGGRVAGQMLTAYTEFYTNPSTWLNNMESPEAYLQALARVKAVPWSIVPKNWFPYFMALHVKPPEVVFPVLCFRGLRSTDLDSPTDSCVPVERVLAACAVEPDALISKVVNLRVIPFCEEVSSFL